MKKCLICTLAAALLLCGCGSSAKETEARAYDTGADYAAEEAVFADEAYMEDYIDEADYDYYNGDVAMEEGETVQTVTFAENKKIIYQANVVIETLQYSETYSKLIEIINKYEGYIEYENYENELRSYLRDNNGKGKLVISTNNLTIRIPSKNYAAFMQEGLSLGNVLNRNQTIEDRTSEYNTNKSYVDILNDEAEYLAKQLNVLENELKEAQANDKHYDEIIENMKDIAERKAQVEKELVPYKRTMDDIDEKVEYSTITMELREVDEYTVIEQEEEEEPEFISQLKETWTNAMEALLNLLKGTLLFLIRIIPALVYLAIIGAIVLLIVKLVRKYRAKHPKMPKNKKYMQNYPNQPMNQPMNQPAVPNQNAINQQAAAANNTENKTK